ncbi:molybdopterin molybdotransferase MoeA [Streptomyces californicus]|uniref:molybdopterin molybdotransferase MoeA n=1 Tax=Streptomyces californicus TaxID=67351 RepID=UPI00296F84C2|nr:molybdopterin molybdotransferase MoeA [Streptomyces californicus]MDW4901602.1 molybdopterin molybdotransferase MoeA [Streptomyces californicus]
MTGREGPDRSAPGPDRPAAGLDRSAPGPVDDGLFAPGAVPGEAAGSARARAEEELAIEQALALVGGSTLGPSRPPRGQRPGGGGDGDDPSGTPDGGEAWSSTPRTGDGRNADPTGTSPTSASPMSSTPTSTSSTDTSPMSSTPNARTDAGAHAPGNRPGPHSGGRVQSGSTSAGSTSAGSTSPRASRTANKPAPSLSWSRARAVAARAGRGGPLIAVRLPLDRALGHVLAEPLGALTDLPSFDTSAMDGWAVAGPGPWAFEAGAGILAGHAPATALPDGAAVRIATGARVPPDTTAVIRSEHAYADEAKGLLHAERSVATGQDIRPRGQECRSGEQLVPAGTVVTPAVLGLAAAAGYDALPAVPRPRVDILVLGDELLAVGLPHDGLIRDALGPMLGPWLRALGAEVAGPRRLGDDAGALRDALAASGADLIVTTGGTASGPVDHVHPVLAELGAELLVDGVAVRPGHPMLLARLPASGPSGAHTAGRSEGQRDATAEQRKESPGGPYLIGLPGNPLAAVSGLVTLVEPLLAGLAGRPAQDAYRALVHAEVHGHPHDTRIVPVVHRAGRAGGRDHVAPLRYNGPAMLRGIAAADGLAVVEPGGVRSGTEVEILDLPWAPATPWTEGCFT